MAAGEAVLLRLLGEFDAREGWAMEGVLSCAHWVSWRLGVMLPTARERVRVARALRELPLLAAALGAGRLSYAQARAITRVASAQDEAMWVELARHTNAAQLEKATRGVGRVRRAAERAADPERCAYEDRVRMSWTDDGTLVLTLRIAPAHAPQVIAALEQAQADEQTDRDVALAALAVGAMTRAVEDVSAETSEQPNTVPVEYVYVEPPYPVLRPLEGIFDRHSVQDLSLLEAWRSEVADRRAQARAWREHREQLERLAVAAGVPAARASLADGLIRALTRPAENKPVKVQLLVDPVSGWARTSRDEMLPPSTLNLRRYDSGRRSRVVSSALRTLLGQLDGECCRFPGCTRNRNLHAHHVRFWRDGGSTDLANLLLVCARHHTLIHRDGYQLTLAPDRRLTVTTREGTTLLHHPALPWQDPRTLPGDSITAHTLPTDWNGDRMDLSHVVTVLLQHAA